ncbi:hypothetical protein BKA64DRAFT_774200 [Cadophora sp. MPI-SDFR-AT-0126]|nr:hypothetical protein BKA64DRAFT_774200 [Leotiomycetes sp. MPI-SDFR-AT-0126]
MPYTSVLPLMKERAEKENLDYWTIRTYYAECLWMIQSGASAAPLLTPDTHQYRAENQAWSYFFPEDPFPGINPQPDLLTLGAGDHVWQPQSCGPSQPASSYIPNPSHLASQPQRKASKDGSDHMLPSTEQVYPRWTCGNCQEHGHTLADCTRHLDSYGFVSGCPKCNTRDHFYDSCQGNTRRQDLVKDYHFLVFRRVGKPPIRTKADVRSLGNGAISNLRGMPQTYEFALDRKQKGLPQNPDEIILDPIWTVHPENIKDQSHPLCRISQDNSTSNRSDQHIEGMNVGSAVPVEAVNVGATPGYQNHNSSAIRPQNDSTPPVLTGFPPPPIPQHQQVPPNTPDPVSMGFPSQFGTQLRQILPRPEYGVGPVFYNPAGPPSNPPPRQNGSTQTFQQQANFQNGNLYANQTPLEYGTSFTGPIPKSTKLPHNRGNYRYQRGTMLDLMAVAKFQHSLEAIVDPEGDSFFAVD